MAENRLHIVEANNPDDNLPKANLASPSNRRYEAQGKYERLWLKNPKKFDPLTTSLGRIRIDRTWKEIEKMIDLKGKKATDLGCGYGVLSIKMRDAGAHVDAIDIASNALKHLEMINGDNISMIQDWMPQTRLEDNAYDLVVCTDLIAELPQTDFRLFFSELSRLVKNDGFVVCSTPIDINSDDALMRFERLVDTEFDVVDWTYGYHRLYIRLLGFVGAPACFYRCSRDKHEYKRLEREKRGLNRLWFKMNSSYMAGMLWGVIRYVTNPLHKMIEQSDRMALWLEKISSFIWDVDGVSHVIFVGKRKPLVVLKPAPVLGKDRTRKWE